MSGEIGGMVGESSRPLETVPSGHSGEWARTSFTNILGLLVPLGAHWRVEQEGTVPSSAQVVVFLPPMLSTVGVAWSGSSRARLCQESMREGERGKGMGDFRKGVALMRNPCLSAG